MTKTKPKPIGFAALSPEQRRAVSRRGGKASHASGNGHKFTSEEAREAGRKGGVSVSADSEHMAEIGKRGGQRKKGYRSAEEQGTADAD